MPGSETIGANTAKMEFTVTWRHKRDQQAPALPQSVSISGIHSSAIAVGSNNYTVQGSSVPAGLTVVQLDEAIAVVRCQVETQAGSLMPSAMSQVAALDRAAKADPPDTTVIAEVRDWFRRNLPLILPAVLEVAAHPTVDTAIKAAAQFAQGQTWREPGPARGGGGIE
jgi:hypothetical protein